MPKTQDVVILCDRGLMDGSAFIEQQQWQAVLDDLGLNTLMLKDNRYEGVLHLVTAADGAEDFYDMSTNEARYDTIESAMVQDKRLQMAYYDHPKWIMIDNKSSLDFDDKMNRTKEAVYSILGIRTGAQFFKKFLLKKSLNSTSVEAETEIPIDLSGIMEFEGHEVQEDFINF